MDRICLRLLWFWDRRHMYTQHLLGTCWCQKNKKKIWNIGQFMAWGMFKGKMEMNRRGRR